MNIEHKPDGIVIYELDKNGHLFSRFFNGYTEEEARENFAEALRERNGITQAEPSDAGCWVDGHWGQYGLAHLIDKAESYGYADAEMIDYATRHLAAMYPNPAEGLSNDEWQAMHDGADELEQWLNENVAPAGYAFGWYDGEFYLWTDGEWENTY